jgi:hexosaminidase
MKRFPLAFFLMFLLCAGSGAVAQTSAASPTCADLHLVPAPRECTAVSSIRVGESGVSVSAGSDAEDAFAASDLEHAIASDDVVVGSGRTAAISLLRAETPGAKALLANHHLQFDPASHDEGYAIVPDGAHGLAVVAETSAGLFYGAQTVKQFVRGEGKDAVLLVPTLRDWPAMAHRGISDDWSRGPLPNMEFLKREIRTLAAYKYNIFSPYFEHTFAYPSSPVAAFPGGAMTPNEGRELVEYATKYHIVIIPEQESFGHLHHVLKFEQFSPVGENPHGQVLAPGAKDDWSSPGKVAGEAGSLSLIGSWFAELAQVFPGPWVHIGADETDELGKGRTHDEVKQRGLGAVYLDFLTQIHTTLEPNHKRLLFWGDIAENSPELVGTLPKDMIAVPWHYDAQPDFTKAIEPFKKAGLETWVAPGVNNWNRLYPNNNEALGNIRGFVRDGQKLGSKGMLNTVWNDDGEGIFDENWFGLLFGAAASWQPGESSEDAFAASYGWAFHRDPTGRIDQAQQEIRNIHSLLKTAGLEDAQDRYFWDDPFSPEGQSVAAKLRPVVSEMRLHAERAITLVAQARAGGKLENTEALDALELGARRIDFVGLKFEAADECAALYAQAQAIAGDKSRNDEVENSLYTIGSNNGRMEDIRDGYALLRGLYQQAWLRDNRPYWLQIDLSRYDRATQLWIDRGLRWELVIHQWYTTHTLPSAAEAGLPGLPAAPGK